MGKKKTTERTIGLPGAVLLGAGIALLLLLLLTLATAGLIWGGIIPTKTPSLVLGLLACFCSFLGGRASVRRWKGGTLVAGGLTGLVLCAVLTAACFGTAGGAAFPGPWLLTLALVLAGGCLAGLGRGKRK